MIAKVVYESDYAEINDVARELDEFDRGQYIKKLYAKLSQKCIESISFRQTL